MSSTRCEVTVASRGPALRMVPAKLSLRVLMSSHCSIASAVGVQRKVTRAPAAEHWTSGVLRLAPAAWARGVPVNNATPISARDNTSERRPAARRKPAIAAIVPAQTATRKLTLILGIDTNRSVFVKYRTLGRTGVKVSELCLG